jgi:hypothetical protein
VNGSLGVFEPSSCILRGDDDFSDPDAEGITHVLHLVDGYYALRAASST